MPNSNLCHHRDRYRIHNLSDYFRGSHARYSINGATGIIINITGGSDLTLYEVNEASSLITEEADEEAEIIFGSVIDESLKDEVRVTVIATGFQSAIQKEEMSPLNEPLPERETQSISKEAPSLQTATPQQAASLMGLNLMSPVVQKVGENPELTSARQLAREIGKRFFETEEYDIPTFLRRQSD